MKLISAQPVNSLARESMKELVGGWLELPLFSSDKTLSLCNSLNLLICSQQFFLLFFYQGSFSIALLLGLDTCFFPQELSCCGARNRKLWHGSANPCYSFCFSIALETRNRGGQGLKLNSVMAKDYV